MMEDILKELLAERDLAIKKVEDVLRAKAGVERGDVHEVAEFLHRRLCRYSHESYCSWWFTEWDQPARKSYLKKAEELIAVCSQYGVKPIVVFEIADILAKPLE